MSTPTTTLEVTLVRHVSLLEILHTLTYAHHIRCQADIESMIDASASRRRVVCRLLDLMHRYRGMSLRPLQPPQPLNPLNLRLASMSFILVRPHPSIKLIFELDEASCPSLRPFPYFTIVKCTLHFPLDWGRLGHRNIF